MSTEETVINTAVAGVEGQKGKNGSCRNSWDTGELGIQHCGVVRAIGAVLQSRHINSNLVSSFGGNSILPF